MSKPDLTEEGFFKSVEDFVTFSQGDHAIKKILIANNGIGATKAIRSIRRWAFGTFGDSRAIKFVVMATPDDMRANAEYIRLADQVVDVPGGSNNNNYANINLICQIAESLKVDAVMPMWGHASENPSLPTSLLKLKHRVTFIGPKAEPMYALGDKIGSTIIAQSAGVPTIGWNGDALRVDYKATGIPQSVYDEANVLTAEDALACAERIGYPVMIKASEGGGGKGIRKVHRSADVADLFRQVQGEIPGSPIFVMKMASKARHLEVQLLGDKYGDAIALSGRDCSVQRRHQKIIEEGPPIAAPIDVFKKMERAAVSLAKTVDYSNAGTVEYLYLEETQQFAFLELNPRLQVEHPVTENILNLNLPACQLQVAMGLPLHRIGDIRQMYGRHILGTDTIDFEYAEKVPYPHHCIAVRVTAENPEAGFQPTSGDIEELQFKSAIDVWGYFSVDNSGLIHEFADSQFGHIFAGGPDRETARRSMIVALKELSIRGNIRTTIEYIIKMLQSSDFVNNRIDTDWLDGRIANHKQICIEENLKYCPSASLVAACGAALQGYKRFMERDAEFVQLLRIGQVPTKDSLSPVVAIDLIYENIKYMTKCLQSGGENVIVQCNGQSQNISVRTLADGGYLLNVNGSSHLAYTMDDTAGSLRMILDGTTCMFTPEYDPTKLSSAAAGKLARLLVDDGAHVNAGDAYVEIEVMKMYMPLKALEAGVVTFQKTEGATLAAGDVIATVVLDNPDAVVTAEVFKSSLFGDTNAIDGDNLATDIVDQCSGDDTIDGPRGVDGSEHSVGSGRGKSVPVHVKLQTAQSALEQVLAGYPLSEDEVGTVMKTFLTCMKDPLLPFLKVESAMSVLRGRIDNDLAAAIMDLNGAYQTAVVNHNQLTSPRSRTQLGETVKFPAVQMLQALQTAAQKTPIEKRAAFNAQTAELWATIEPYVFSTSEIILSELVKFLGSYLSVEQMFDDMSFTDVVNRLRKVHSSELENVLKLCRSHVNISAKNVLLLRVIDEIKSFPAYGAIKRPQLPAGLIIKNEIHTRKIKTYLTELAELRENLYSHVSFAANLLLIDQMNTTAESRHQRFHQAIVGALNCSDVMGDADRVEHMLRFVNSNVVFRDILIESLRHDQDYQLAVIEMYLRKIYQKTHYLHNLEGGSTLVPEEEGANCWVKFNFETNFMEKLIESSMGSGASSKTGSFTDLTALGCPPAADLTEATKRVVVKGMRKGVFAVVESIDKLPLLFSKISAKIPQDPQSLPVNAVHVAILTGPEASATEEDVATKLGDFLSSQVADLRSRFVRRVTFFVGPAKDGTNVAVSQGSKVAMPVIYTFRTRVGFAEDRLFRHIEAPHAFHLDLHRLSNFSITLEDGIQTASGNVHLYRAVPKTGKGSRRFFARLVSFTGDVHGADVESLYVEALDHLALVLGKDETKQPLGGGKPSANHVFINVVSPDTVIHPDFYDTLLRKLCAKYGYKMMRLGVTTVALKLTCRLSLNTEPQFLRLIASNPTGFVLKIDQYIEAAVNGKTVFKSISRGTPGEWDGKDVHTPYPVSKEFEELRAAAAVSSETLYAYDWPTLFQSAAELQWAAHTAGTKGTDKKKLLTPGATVCSPGASPTPISFADNEKDLPDDFYSCKELVLCDRTTQAPFAPGWTAKKAEDSGVLLPVTRRSGLNDVGMVGWHIKMMTPECPAGREVVVICNDITFQAGSFGTREDIFFYKASEYARTRGLPRLFLTANSGARIGMAQTLKKMFRVCWVDESDPSKGFKYIYISKDSYAALLDKANGKISNMPVICVPEKGPGGVEVYRITDIIGEEPDLGVENLMGSGLIAGETSRAYQDIFTLTLVVGRTVGIGAYLVRLGQRTIQKTRNAPIILTGYQALNKLMGREIYTTNDQLGGPMIMYPNGVSHLLAETHFDSVLKAMEWLSFVPVRRGGALPVRSVEGVDTIDRLVQFAPKKGVTYDPRHLITGVTGPDNTTWQSGFFDRGSFVEVLAGWAKTVVVGRGRLGGIPMGVIVTENRTAEATKPADPADSTSQEKLVQQAGGVWFPDSAYKTAQALKDFNKEGLPCIVFANWRGFSGGQRDMFDEVLKFGSMIVDSLVAYQQPLFVYIPPFAELRGGAWVVVDSTINADVMEFYAAEDARGGVLEAAGAASIKFREKDIIATAHRVDPVLVDLDAKLAALTAAATEETGNTGGDKASTGAEQKELQRLMRQRERMLFGVYQQVAVHFADLHDTPGRMHAKGVIRRQVQWAESRAFFYWRLRRRLLEFQFCNELLKGSGRTPVAGQQREQIARLCAWFVGQPGCSASMWEDDKAVLKWWESHTKEVAQFIATSRTACVTAEISSKLADVVQETNSAEALKLALKGLPKEQRELLMTALK